MKIPKKLNIVLSLIIIIVALTSCSRINANNWRKKALLSNHQLYLKCIKYGVNCEKDYNFGKTSINQFSFNNYRLQILQKYLNIDSGKVVLYEYFGSGEVVNYYFVAYHLNNSNNAIQYDIDLSNGNINVTLIVLTEQDVAKIKQFNYSDQMKASNWIKKWELNGTFVSYTTLLNGKISAVEFIPNPEVFGTILH